MEQSERLRATEQAAARVVLSHQTEYERLLEGIPTIIDDQTDLLLRIAISFALGAALVSTKEKTDD